MNYTQIIANGKKFYVNYSISAFMLFEKNTGTKVMKLLNDVQLMDKEEDIPLDLLFTILKIGLDRGMNKNHSDMEVLDFQDDLIAEFGMENAFTKIMEAVDRSLNSEKSKKQEAYYRNQPKKHYKGGKNKVKK